MYQNVKKLVYLSQLKRLIKYGKEYNIATEIESKYKICDLFNFQKILTYLNRNYPQISFQKMTNYLLDSSSFQLRQRKLILRLRISNDCRWISLKGKNQELGKLNFARRIEVESTINGEKANTIKKRGIYLSDLPEEIKHYLIREIKNNQVLFNIWGQYKVNRHIYEYKNIATICLDEVFYPGLADYELEIELNSDQELEKTEELISQLEDQSIFNLQPSYVTKSELLQNLIKSQ